MKKFDIKGFIYIYFLGEEDSYLMGKEAFLNPQKDLEKQAKAILREAAEKRSTFLENNIEGVPKGSIKLGEVKVKSVAMSGE